MQERSGGRDEVKRRKRKSALWEVFLNVVIIHCYYLILHIIIKYKTVKPVKKIFSKKHLPTIMMIV